MVRKSLPFFHTKIVATIGPAVNTIEKMVQLMRAGMSVARLNFSHGTHEEHRLTIERLKKAREQEKQPLAIMLDTKGPEIRIGRIQNGELFLPEGHRLLLIKEEKEGNLDHISIKPAFVLDKLTKGMHVLFDNGYIISEVVEVSAQGVEVEIQVGGIIRSGKGVNVPNEELGLPYITEKDLEDLRFGVELDVDIIAASFVRNADQVAALKEFLKAEGKPEILVIAKIENQRGVSNFDSIVQIADGIMIARGDLGVEVPSSRVPQLQKMMIRKSALAGKPSITATQMLETMMQNPRPTRAETSDVANAIYDSTSAVMLSGETAIGHYPIETVDVMRTIALEAEKDFEYREFFNRCSQREFTDIPSSITLATVKASYNTKAKAIFTFTTGGSTAHLLSCFRPKMPIIAMTPNLKCYHQLALAWGVIPFYEPNVASIEEAFEKISAFALSRGLVNHGDLVIVTAGHPFGVRGTTNMILIDHIGEVLVQGRSGMGKQVYGNVLKLLTIESRSPWECQAKLLVITRCDEEYDPFMRESLGVILQNHHGDQESEEYLLKWVQKEGKSAIVYADGACHTLNDGQMVTMDPTRGLVYKGVMT